MDQQVNAARRVAKKIAIVAGAGSGIGAATAALLAQQGAVVVCADLNLEAANAVARSIRDNNGQAQPMRLDVVDETSWRQVMNEVLNAHGRLDILVNSAGISFASPVADMDLEEWQRVIRVNLDGVFLGTKHAIQTMRLCQAQGSIVNIASISGLQAQPGATAYCASKSAAIMFSKAAALECLRNNDTIRINSVSPSGVKTPMWSSMPFFQDLIRQHGSEDAAYDVVGGASPQARWALPAEVARAILFLASDESSCITGTNLVFDNGAMN